MSQIAQPLPPDIAAWLAAAVEDARRRGVPQLEPLLRSLARSTAALRATAWQESVAARLPQDGRE
jgi:hypothetical protein